MKTKFEKSAITNAICCLIQQSFEFETRRFLFVSLILSLVIPISAILTTPAFANEEIDSAPTGNAPHIFLPLIMQDNRNSSSDGLWRDVVEADLVSAQSLRQIIPQKYRLVALNGTLFQQVTSASALGSHSSLGSISGRISLPLPNGQNQWFTLFEAPVMEAGLAAKFPEIKTYAGHGIDDSTASIRLDWTPGGFHGLILSAEGTVYIDPYSKADTVNYISYYRSDLLPDDAERSRTPDLVEAEVAVAQSIRPGIQNRPVASGSQLRTYRLAMAATGEYAQFFSVAGETAAQTRARALAAIVTTVNRVVGIYEREVAVRLVLVNNNDQIIYTDPTTDPYSNGDDRGANQTNIDNVIGNNNYDIGHVVGTGGGGVATLGNVCTTGQKARGVTGSGTPIGDAFDVDYVAHEMGHQFGANHTWNGTQGSCTNDQHNNETAFEPGSGSTIMGYAGICGTDDLQPNGDPYFHSISIDEIVAYTTSGSGNACPTVVNSGNGVPAANAGSDFTIPARTPFTLSGSGSDPDNDALTYAWEEFDTGSAGPPNDSTRPPYFRSFPPQSSSARTFPRIQDLVNNRTSPGEILPTVGGTLNFRLTLRDNRAAGGGVNQDTMQVNVAATAGPFWVTVPDTPITWQVSQAQTVAWDVANTTAAPVNCASVMILLSTDGGFTYPVTLASGVPNNGSAVITVPNEPTLNARVKITCATNIFFDISNHDFTVIPKANAGGPYMTDEGIDITLDAGASSASDEYAWDFNNDGLFDDAIGVKPVFSLVGKHGSYTVAVRVTKNSVSDIATTTVIVNNIAPSIVYTNTPTTEGAEAIVTGEISDPGWLNALSGTINWGDGTGSESLTGNLENLRPNASLSLKAIHVYADNGQYEVKVCASDDAPSTTCISFSLTVINVTPTVNAGQDQIVYEGDVAHLDPTLFNDKGTLDTHTAMIDWGDGSAPEVGIVNESPFGPPGSVDGANGTVSGQHQYIVSPGIYTVTVTVTDKDGGVGADTLNITVVPGFFRFCAYADEMKEDSSLSLIAKWATLDCAQVIGGAPGKTRAGGVGSRGSLEAEDHARIQGDIVSLQGEIVLKGDSMLTGNIAALDDVELEDYARAEGNVTSAGNILLKNHSVVTGDANAGGDIQLQEQSVISGAINAFTTVPPLAQITPVQFALSAGAQDVTVDQETHLALDPGSYRDVEIGTGATLTLRTGRYTFRQFETTRAAIIAFDLADGPIVIDVVSNVAFAEQTQMVVTSATGDAADILFRVGGDQIYLAEEGVYLGTFLGLDSKAKLGQNATLTGALYGEQVEIRERTQIVGQPAVKVFAAMFSAPTP